MRDRVFLRRAELGERTAVRAVRRENRIVAKAALAARRTRHDADKRALHVPRGAVWIDDCDHRAESCATLIVGYVAKFTERLVDVVGVGGVNPRVPRAPHPGSPI